MIPPVQTYLMADPKQLAIGEHETTEDGKYSLVTEECLAGCDHAPCLLVNERLHKRVKPQDVANLLSDPSNDRIHVTRSELFDATAVSRVSIPRWDERGVEGGVGSTSDVREMREAD